MSVLCCRAVILHKDIASKNIVLDDMFNARLIDFGLAREEDDKSTTGGGNMRVFYSHPNVGKETANESWDYYSFGVSKYTKLR
jgi:serine/threonine protein kinase